MYDTKIRRRALARIHNAIQAGIGYAYNDGGEGAGGGGTKPEAKPEAKPVAVAVPVTLGLTQADLDQRIADALADQQRKADDKAAKEKGDREAEEARKRGEFETVANQEKTKREAAEARVKSLELDKALRDHLAEHKPEYAKAAGLISKIVDAGEADTDKAVKAAVAEYEKSLPEKPRGSAAVPATPRVNWVAPGTGETRTTRRPFSHLQSTL